MNVFYSRWISGALAVIVLLAGCSSPQRMQPKAGLPPVAPATSTTEISDDAPRKLHYLFAHRLLPNLFFTKSEGFLGYLESNGDQFLGELWASTASDVPASEKIGADGLSTEREVMNDGTELYFITLPEPQRVPEAYHVALVVRGNLRKYLTLEKTYTISGAPERSLAYFCSWEPDASHVVYHAVEYDGLVGFKALVVRHLEESKPDAILAKNQEARQD